MIKPKFYRLSMIGALGLLALGTILSASVPLPDGAKIIPTTYNNIDYVYVYGPRGKKSSGCEDSLQIIFYRVPRNAADEVTLFVYDPGSTGSLDKKSFFSKKTTTRFKVYGGVGAYSDPRSQSVVPSSDQPGTVLDTKTYVDEHEYEWVKFGPFDITDGEIIGDYAYFKLVAEATKGASINLFKTAIVPNSANAFSYSLTIRLNNKLGATMGFDVEIPGNVDEIMEYNYDLDKGGEAFFTTPSARYKLYGSESGSWLSNIIELDQPLSSTKKLKYEIIKGTQGRANGGFYFTDGDGNPLKIYLEGDADSVREPAVFRRETTNYDDSRAYMDMDIPATSSVCESASNELYMIKQVPGEVSLGETYTMILQVTAQMDLIDVKVTDTIPSGASFIKSDPPATEKNDELVWNIDKMANSEMKEFKVTLKADREGELYSCGVFAAIPVGCLTTLVGEPILAIEKTGPEKALIHDTVTYTIVVKNTGTAVARNVVVQDNIPDGLEHASGERVLTFNVGDLAPEEGREYSVTCSATQPGRVCNPAEATSDNTNRVDDEACTVILEPMLEVTKSGKPEQYLGKKTTYEIVVSNPGDTTLTDVEVVDITPPQTSIVSASGARISGNSATWTLPELKAGENLKFPIVLTSTIPGTWCNNVSARTAEGLSGDSESCTLWKGYPALLLEVIDTVDPLQIGEKTIYQIRITNQGTANDSNVGIVARFPSEIKPVQVSGSTSGSIDGKKVTFTGYPQLTPKEVIEFVIEAEAVKEGDSRLKVEMNSDLLRKPVTEEESTHVY